MVASTYSEEIAATICQRLAAGDSLRTICATEGMPAKSTIFVWLQVHEDFRAQYALARQWQAETLVDDMVDISDESGDDWRIDDEGNLVVNHDAIARCRLRVDTRKWVASRMHPRMYGDRVTQEHVGAGGGPIRVQAVDLSDDELAAIALRSGQ
ncbi:MAG: hypothetical protein KF822_09430 [Steroidobacteraceae bacterium]|nr:hypothetical protein [Steroidobacteraceae bacterium]